MEKLQSKPCTTELFATNNQPIATRGTVCLTFKKGPEEYVHEYYVLKEAKANCLIGLNFLRANKCDPLISQDRIELDDNTQVPLYHCKNDVESSSVFRVVTTETVSVPAGYTMVVPAHIPDWRRPLEEMDALFEPSSRFDERKDASAPCILFNFAEETIPVRIQNSGDETLTLYKHTTLGTSEIIGMLTLNRVAKGTERVAN